jgi:hypothetical protein
MVHESRGYCSLEYPSPGSMIIRYSVVDIAYRNLAAGNEFLSYAIRRGDLAAIYSYAADRA